MFLARAFAAKAVLYQMGVCERPAEMRKDDKGQPTDNFDDLIDELGALWIWSLLIFCFSNFLCLEIIFDVIRNIKNWIPIKYNQN